MACATPAEPVPAEFRISDPARQSIVVGRIEMIGSDGAPQRRLISPNAPVEMLWRVGVAFGTQYTLRTEPLADGGMVGDFSAVLPAGPYVWDTPPCTDVPEGLVMILQPGTLTYVGTLRMQYNALLICKFSVVDDEAATVERFRASHPGLDVPVKKELVIRFPD